MNYTYNLGMLFEDNLAKYASNIAVKYENEQFTYKQLNERANEYIYLLKSYEILMGDVIVIANIKTFNSYALMIACITSGVIYVNIDVDNPFQRLLNIVDTCKPKIVFHDDISDDIEKVCKLEDIKNVNLNINIGKSFDDIVNESIDGNRIAYIMFTSGSTGKPKGVAITHQNLIHFINWGIKNYNVSEADNFANLSPMYFDNSVFDFYIGLFSGATLTPIKKELLTKPMELVNYIDKMKCTIWFSVPTLLIYLLTMRVLTKEKFTSIRIITFGGEGFPKTELKKLYSLFNHRTRFVNVYGPTECTCICSSYDINDADFEDLNELPSLGKINQNFSFVILDDNNCETNRGELCLLGPNVGLGYYNDYERTKQSFIISCLKTISLKYLCHSVH